MFRFDALMRYRTGLFAAGLSRGYACGGAANKVGIYLRAECNAFVADKKAIPVRPDPIAQTPAFNEAPHFVLRLFAE
jgi:hypothetical protein